MVWWYRPADSSLKNNLLETKLDIHLLPVLWDENSLTLTTRSDALRNLAVVRSMFPTVEALARLFLFNPASSVSVVCVAWSLTSGPQPTRRRQRAACIAAVTSLFHDSVAQHSSIDRPGFCQCPRVAGWSICYKVGQGDASSRGLRSWCFPHGFQVSPKCAQESNHLRHKTALEPEYTHIWHLNQWGTVWTVSFLSWPERLCSSGVPGCLD